MLGEDEQAGPMLTNGQLLVDLFVQALVKNATGRNSIQVRANLINRYAREMRGTESAPLVAEVERAFHAMALTPMVLSLMKVFGQARRKLELYVCGILVYIQLL